MSGLHHSSSPDPHTHILMNTVLNSVYGDAFKVPANIKLERRHKALKEQRRRAKKNKANYVGHVRRQIEFSDENLRRFDW